MSYTGVNKKWLEDHDKAIRNAALDKAIEEITSQLNDMDRNWKGMNKSIGIIKSLRSGVMAEEHQLKYIITEELMNDIKFCLCVGCDGTLPNERELLNAIVKYAQPLSNELRKERVKVMDTFGILHGEDAIRFNKYLNSHEPLNQRAQEIVRQARDLVAEDKNRETTHILNDAFFSMDIFFGDIPMDEHIIKWAVSKQDSFVTAAMACYLESRKLRGTL